MGALRVGLVGIGAMGRHHARVLRELDGVELAGIADEAGDRYGAAGGVPVVTSVDELIGLGLDMAVIAVPTAMHEPIALEFAKAGVHTFVEKPIAVDAEAGQRMVDAFASAGLVGAVGHIERFNPAVQEMRQRVEAGELGAVYQITTRRQGPFPARIADVGVIKDLGSHDIDLAGWVADSQYDTVSAQITRRSGREHEDMMLAVGRLANGIIVNHVVNWLSPMKERVTVAIGERGALVADTMTSDLTFYANGNVPTVWDAVRSFRGVSEGDVTRYAFPKREPLRVEHEAFRDAVLGTRHETVTMGDGLRTLQVVEACLTSAATDQVVRVRHQKPEH